MSLPFLFGIHNHQPLGNFDYVIERLTTECYKPFLEEVKKYKYFKFSFHASGVLFRWWEAHRPDMLDLLGELIAQEQIELVCGGFFEPILASIPREDRKEQILRHKDYLRQKFGASPVGLWLTERVWEQSLVEDLVDLGLQYVVVDDRHFLVSGFETQDLYGYYLTEAEGKRLAVFPIDENLRYAIPFWPVNRLEAYIKDLISRGAELAIYFDDGEKFGAWPGTYKWVYKEGWLKEFLSSLGQWTERGLVRSMTFAEALKEFSPKGLAYLPTASYMEMEEWALPAKRILELEELHQRLNTEHSRFRSFIRGGHWKNFFVKYSEANYLHKRMLQVSQLSRSTKPFDQEARLNLLAAQCNDAYWHGIFGGLYLPHLRQAVWQALLSAEERLRSPKTPQIISEDTDFDGKEELFYSSSKAVLVFKPSYGAHLVEWSNLFQKHNLQNTLTRRFEAYHVNIKEAAGGLEPSEEGVSSIHHLRKKPSSEVLAALVYDWYDRHSLVEHFFDPAKGLADFIACNFGEWGDFANQPFRYHRQRSTLLFFRDGGLYPPGSGRRPLLMRKKVAIKEAGLLLEISYDIEYRSSESTRCRFGVEFNFYPPFMVTGKGGIRLDHKPIDVHTPQDLWGEELEIWTPSEKKICLQVPEKTRFYIFPLRTVSQSEEGFDLTVQGITIMPFWEEEFRLGASFKKNLRIRWC